MKRVKMEDVQEVRYCLKTLREQMAARHNNNNDEQFPTNGHKIDSIISKGHGTNGFVNGTLFKYQEGEDNCFALKEAIKHLCARLQEMEQRHQKEKTRLEAENSALQRHCLEEHNHRVQKAETRAEEQSRRIEVMQKHTSALELENLKLREKLAASEIKNQEGIKNRCAQLEEELVTVKKKNHNLNDMVQSIQKKIRHMIEQVQNSRTIMEQRDREVRDLMEKVSFLEAENREMHDRMEYLNNQVPYDSDTGSKVVYSKPLIPTSPRNKSFPFIKVIEIKS